MRFPIIPRMLVHIHEPCDIHPVCTLALFVLFIHSRMTSCTDIKLHLMTIENVESLAAILLGFKWSASDRRSAFLFTLASSYAVS